MVTVRQTHSTNQSKFQFDEWFNSLHLSDQTREQAVKECYEFCLDLPASPDTLQFGCEMVEILAMLNMDAETLKAAMLYPFWRHKLVKTQLVEKHTSLEVLKLLLSVDKMDAIRVLQTRAGTALAGEQVDNLRRMLLAMVEDVRAIVVKLALVIMDLRAVRKSDEESRVLTAKEASTIYAPLANRLGIGQLKWEIEDYAFRFLHPDTYKGIAARLDEKRTDRQTYIEDFVGEVKSALANMKIEGDIAGRPKHIFSIWKKMQHKALSFENLYDIRAVRILVNDIPSCYMALGAVHTRWNAISKEFDDYIASPKPNGYQSIHTVVVGPLGKPVEIQIRTHQMHQDAELGVAAHWRYKEGSANGKQDAYQDKINWLRKLLAWQEEVNEEENLVDELRSQVFEDRVYVFTPKGDVVDLPKGATPLDFAYYIHSNVGHRCTGAKVSGKIVPFTYSLQSGDQIEVLTTKQPNPSRDWLNPSLGYLKSSRARAKVHTYFKQQDKEKNREAGRELVESELARHDLTLKAIDDKSLTRFNVNNIEELSAAVGIGDVRVGQIVNFIESQRKKSEPIDLESLNRPEPEQRSAKREQGVVVNGVGNLMTYLAKCCQPVPGDSIVGYITQGKGISVHRDDCMQLNNMLKQQPEREVYVEWGGSVLGGYRASVRVCANDRGGLLRDISTLLSNEKVTLLGVHSHTDNKTNQAFIDLKLEVQDVGSLSKVLARLTQIQDVYEAFRLK